MFALFCAVATCSVAQATDVELPETDGEVVIDGRLDDPAWQDAAAIELIFETHPGENLPARVRTVAYLMEDGENLYIGFTAHDPNPAAIRAYLRDRDSAYQDDYVGIIIDTYNDGRRAFEFFSNPLGVQMDLTNNQDSTDGQEDDSWDAIWDSVGRIGANGYVVEMRIPLTQLRFPAMAGRKTWGFELTRNYPRDIRFRFSSIRLERGNNCYLCQLGKARGFERAKPGRDLEIVPTLTALQSKSTDDPGVDPLVSNGTKTEAGLSMRWGISPDLTANLAINPDFSQIESDVAQLDVNNRFALFYPEKRPFFLEGADYFATPIDAVFTRTISNPEVGAKLTGKRGDNTFGVMLAQDEVTTLLFPGPFGSDSTTLEQENTALIGRYSRGFGNTSSIGGILTIRSGDDYHNYLGGFDARWKINDSHTLRAQYLETETRYPNTTAVEFDQPLETFDGNGSVLTYDFASREWHADVRYINMSEGFRADSGFQSKVGGENLRVHAGRIWYGVDGGWWTRVRLRSEYSVGHLEDGTFTDKELSLRLGVGGPMQSWTQLKFEAETELENGVLFNMQSTSLYLEATPRSGLWFQFFVKVGEQIDYENTRLGDQVLYEPSFNWNVSRNLLVRLRSVFASLDTKEGDMIFDAGVVDARFTWQFNVRSFLRLTLQHSDVDRNPSVYIDPVDANSKNVGRQLLYSYKINPQTVFFLGYSDSYLDDDDLDGLTTSDRNVFLKIGYAWNL